MRMKTGQAKPAGAHRRELLRVGVNVIGLSAAASLRSTEAVAQGGPAPAAQVPVEGTRLILLGTQGGPNINLRRSQAASAVVVDGRPYVVDCGYGTLRSL